MKYIVGKINWILLKEWKLPVFLNTLNTLELLARDNTKKNRASNKYIFALQNNLIFSKKDETGYKNYERHCNFFERYMRFTVACVKYRNSIKMVKSLSSVSINCNNYSFLCIRDCLSLYRWIIIFIKLLLRRLLSYDYY